MDETTQVRDRTIPELVKTYRAAMLAYDPDNGDEAIGFPPIRVHEQQGQGDTRPVYIVIDGWHRVAAARALGKSRIEAQVVTMEDPGNLDEMRWMAVVGNMVHGQKLTNAEKRKAIGVYVKANQHRHPGPRGGRANGRFKTLREIGRDLAGMHHETIRRYLATHAPNTLKAILAADMSRNDEEPAEPLKGDFNVDTLRRKKAASAIEELDRLVRLITTQAVLQDIKGDLERVARKLNRKGTRRVASGHLINVPQRNDANPLLRRA
ncbi:hypothetical protein GOB12_02325 [Sinorhizobium meliloti]|nr:hypothetical protein [Sinorhizobium meliloti]MDX0392069.1 hypothetical protein [Sinorhizobium meliloti]